MGGLAGSSGKRNFFLASFVVVFGLFLILSACLLVSVLKTPNYCEMTFMNPSYAELPVASSFAYKYKLLLYREGPQEMTSFINSPFPTGIPVLFIPGNAGHYKQGRSLASTSFYLCEDIKKQLNLEGPTFDFYSVDSREELSALNGEILMEQTQFVNDCIASILQTYQHIPESSDKNKPSRPNSVLLIGHSMGGLVASAVFTQENYIENSVTTILTLNTPHCGHPFFYRRSLFNFYHNTHQYWKENIHSSLQNVSIIAMGGSFRDQLIDSALISLDNLIPTSNSFSVLTTSIPSVWIEMDHQCIVWCNQLALKMSRLLVDLVDSNTFQNTFPLSERMKIFRRHLLSNIPSALGLLTPSDIQFHPKAFLDHYSTMYNNPPQLDISSHPTMASLSTSPPNQPTIKEPHPGVTFIGHPTIQNLSNPSTYSIPENCQAENIHFAFITDLPSLAFDVFLCDHELCSFPLLESIISLPSHSSLRKYSNERRRKLRDQKDSSPQSLVHLSPLQMESYKYVVIVYKDIESLPKVLVAQFYTEKDSLSMKKKWFYSEKWKYEGNHPVVMNISLPFYDRLDSFTATLVPGVGCSTSFLPVAIQYRPALYEQHITTNATSFPLRFHISSADEHRLILLIDPVCPYELQVTLDVPLAIARFYQLNQTPSIFVSAIPAWFAFFFAIQQYIYFKKKEIPSFISVASQGVFLSSLLLIAASCIPDHYYRLVFELFVEYFDRYSFSDYSAPSSPGAIRLLLFCSCCCMVFVKIIFDLLIDMFKLILQLFRRVIGITDDSTTPPNVSKSFILFFLAFLLGFKTHIATTLLFCLLQLAVSYSNLPKSLTHAGHVHKYTIFFVICGVVETIPSVVQFVKAFFYENREDDGFLMFHYSLVVLSFLACHYSPHARRIHFFVPFLVFLLIHTFGLLPFHRVAWFLTVLISSCILSYFPLRKLHTIPIKKNKTE